MEKIEFLSERLEGSNKKGLNRQFPAKYIAIAALINTLRETGVIEAILALPHIIFSAEIGST